MKIFRSHRAPRWAPYGEGGSCLSLPDLTMCFPHVDISIIPRMMIFRDMQPGEGETRISQPLPIDLNVELESARSHDAATLFNESFGTFSECLEFFEAEVLPYLQDYARDLTAALAEDEGT